jgi:DNA topoisomerase-3
MSRPRALFVAEKPSIAKTLAEILSQSRARHRASATSNYNPLYDFDLDLQTSVHAQLPGAAGKCLAVTMTSVCGHLMGIDFAEKTHWRGNSVRLFEAPIAEHVIKGSEGIFENLVKEARHCRLLVIWTDCDREGEAIGAEILRACQSSNPGILVKRARCVSLQGCAAAAEQVGSAPRFSAANHADLWRAVNELRELNEHEVRAVQARNEIDLRLGAAFTRMQTTFLEKRFDSCAGSACAGGRGSS